MTLPKREMHDIVSEINRRTIEVASNKLLTKDVRFDTVMYYNIYAMEQVLQLSKDEEVRSRAMATIKNLSQQRNKTGAQDEKKSQSKAHLGK